MTWDQLYSRVNRHRREMEELSEKKQAEREEADRWCADATRTIMAKLHDTLVERAGGFREETGLEAVVSVLAGPRAGSEPTGGAPISWMSVSVGDLSVGVYAVRPRGGLPRIFLAVPTLESSRANQVDAQLRGMRLVSSPVGDVVKGEVPMLVSLDPDRPSPLSFDHIAYRVFSVLVDCWQGTGEPGPPSSKPSSSP